MATKIQEKQAIKPAAIETAPVSTSDIIRGAGLKSTGARGKILKILGHARKPLRVKDIFERLTEVDEEANMVTVYRTIDTFIKKGIIHRVNFAEDAAYYELHDNAHHKHYISCIGCKRRDEVDTCPYGVTDSSMNCKIPSFDTITHHDVELFGICTACKEMGSC
jgi:Fur family ferric uptake transcriptional regulator